MKDFFKIILASLLKFEARLVVLRYKPHIVAVTGSVGKTSTKDAIYAVVARGAYVRKSEKSFNSEFGLPLTILGLQNAWNNPLRWLQNLLDGLFLIIFPSRYPHWLVLELGADRPNDIRSTAAWLPVDIAVITRLPEVPVHVEFFSSATEVTEEKASLIAALKPQGTLVLYGDDEKTRELRDRAGDRAVIMFGLSAESDVRAENLQVLFEEGAERFPIGMKADLHMQGTSVPIEVVGTLGAHTLYPLLAAAAVGQALEKNIADIVLALGTYEPPPGRMHLIRGIKDSLIIDDTYNSSPAAAEAALSTLTFVSREAGGRKIAVLGDMLELGRHSVDEHKKLGSHAAASCDLLVTIGFRARDIADGALDAGMQESAILQYEDAKKAGQELAALVQKGDIVLVKGSQGIRMERTVEELMAQPERAKELLVRQDLEWKKR